MYNDKLHIQKNNIGIESGRKIGSPFGGIRGFAHDIFSKGGTECSVAVRSFQEALAPFGDRLIGQPLNEVQTLMSGREVHSGDDMRGYIYHGYYARFDLRSKSTQSGLVIIGTEDSIYGKKRSVHGDVILLNPQTSEVKSIFVDDSFIPERRFDEMRSLSTPSEQAEAIRQMTLILRLAQNKES